MASGVYGDRELVAALRELSKGVPMSDVNAAARTAMQPMAEDTKKNARALRDFPGKHPGFPQPVSPRRGGHLDEGIAVARVGGRAKSSRFWLAAGKRARKLAHLLEFGTSPHFQPNLFGGFMHPGAQAHPFMTPAYEAHKDQVVHGFGRAIWQRLRDKALTVSRRTLKRRR